MNQPLLVSITLFCMVMQFSTGLSAQYWQQSADYQIDIRLDDQKNEMQGRARLTYTNRSADTLFSVWLRTDWNMIKPGSPLAQFALDHQDRPLYDLLSGLKAAEQGNMNIFNVRQNSVAVEFRPSPDRADLVEVILSRPIMPSGDYAVLDIAWQASIPVNMLGFGRRRLKTDPEYILQHWYPVVCPYDRYGWHFDSGIGQWADGAEFGKYKVEITMPRSYMVAATGVLQNPTVVGMGYEEQGTILKPNYGVPVHTWVFTGENLQSFGWIADKQLIHTKSKQENGNVIHAFLREKQQKDVDSLRIVGIYQDLTATTGTYPYQHLSIISASQTDLSIPGIVLLNTDKIPADFTSAIRWYFALTDNAVRKNLLMDTERWHQLQQQIGQGTVLRAVLKCREEWQYKRPLFDDLLYMIEKTSGRDLDRF